MEWSLCGGLNGSASGERRYGFAPDTMHSDIHSSFYSSPVLFTLFPLHSSPPSPPPPLLHYFHHLFQVYCLWAVSPWELLPTGRTALLQGPLLRENCTPVPEMRWLHHWTHHGGWMSILRVQVWEWDHGGDVSFPNHVVVCRSGNETTMALSHSQTMSYLQVWEWDCGNVLFPNYVLVCRSGNETTMGGLSFILW